MSTQQELNVSYGLPPEFYELWLDKGVNYSCGLFLSPSDTLEDAQRNKLQFFFDQLHINPHSKVLDIGCGWGGNLRFLSESKGLKQVVGITLAREQYEYLARKRLPNVEVQCVSYRDYQPAKAFDALISIGMFEHISTPEQVRSGEQLDLYRDYFKRAWEWTKPGAYFGLQTVVGARIPRERSVLRELGWATRAIFPGAISPRLEVIMKTVSPHWELIELHTRREHYARTTEQWLARFVEKQDTIKERWGSNVVEEYKQYLAACVAMFNGGYQSLAQMILRRCN